MNNDNNSVKENKNKIRGLFKHLSVHRVIQLSAAVLLTLALLVAYPIYSWFRMQRQIARYEKISVPNSLYLTAGRAEDSRYLEMDNIDITATWAKDSDGSSAGKATYQDYVFTVAGDYVAGYILQLAHTTNNNYYYDIFEADVTNVRPTGADVASGKDYVEYTLTGAYDPSVLSDIADEVYGEAGAVYGNVNAGDTLYYSVKMDNSATPKPISLSADNPAKSNENDLIASVYTIGTGANAKTVSYSGHYLNWSSDFTALGTGYYHNETYGSTFDVGPGSNTKVQTHAEPLYWRSSRIEVEGSVTRKPFIHEYILRVYWTNGTQPNDAHAEYKDTDIVYISVVAAS